MRRETTRCTQAFDRRIQFRLFSFLIFNFFRAGWLFVDVATTAAAAATTFQKCLLDEESERENGIKIGLHNTPIDNTLTQCEWFFFSAASLGARYKSLGQTIAHTLTQSAFREWEIKAKRRRNFIQSFAPTHTSARKALTQPYGGHSIWHIPKSIMCTTTSALRTRTLTHTHVVAAAAAVERGECEESERTNVWQW